jgi:hypothetical protein
MRRFALALAALVGLAAPLLVVTQARADFDLRVTWPTSTEVNPAQTAYRITVSDSGPGSLEARWRDTSVPVPQHGSIDLPLAGEGVGRVEIWRCAGGACHWAGVSSPVLRVYRAVTVWTYPLRVGASTEAAASVALWPLPTSGSVDLTWRIVAGQTGAGATLASGTQSVTASSSWEPYSTSVTLTPPAELVEGGDYSWVLAVDEPFGGGTLSGSSGPQPVLVDKTAPELSVSADVDHLEPSLDGYLDWVTFTAVTAEALNVAIQVYGPDESLVEATTWESASPGVPLRLGWSGRLFDSSDPYPPGDYRVDVLARDYFGNVTTRSFPVSVGDGTLTYVTWKQELKPAAGIKKKSVGRCAKLAIPSARGWPGSVGFYAWASCLEFDGPAGKVWAEYATAVPAAFRNHYRNLRIQALGSGRPHSYLRVGPLRLTTGAWTQRLVRTSAPLLWRGMTIPVGSFVASTPTGGLVHWRVGAEEETRVDVKLLRLSVDYLALVHPSGEIEIPAG